MRKGILLFFLAFNAFVLLQGQVIRLLLLSPQEQIEAAKTLGKTVFAEDKLMILDVQDNLILEVPLSSDLKIIVDSEKPNVTIISSEIEKTFDVGVENTVVVNGIPANSVIRVYSMNGALLKELRTLEDTTTIPMQDLPSGTYIMQVNNTILKVLK